MVLFLAIAVGNCAWSREPGDASIQSRRVLDLARGVVEQAMAISKRQVRPAESVPEHDNHPP